MHVRLWIQVIGTYRHRDETLLICMASYPGSVLSRDCMLVLIASVYTEPMLVLQEFYATGQNKGRVQTRDEALYGYQSSDSDGENDGRKRRRKMGEEKDFSRPVGFVSGGITGSSTEKPKEVEQAEADLSRRQSEGNGLGFGGAGLGLGASDGGMPRGGLGLGFAPAQSGVDDLNGRETDANGESDDDWHANLPTTFGRA